ncbi:MAG: CsbD family protein [Devosia sp.]|nr:CsbD family protein [Devosia sp.]
MNRNRIEGNWERFKGKVQAHRGELTGDDLDTIQGRRKELIGKIQERYGKAGEEVERELDGWLRISRGPLTFRRAALRGVGAR